MKRVQEIERKEKEGEMTERGVGQAFEQHLKGEGT